MDKNQSIANKTASATKWSLVTEFAAKLISPITNMILARLLAPEAFGAVATITMIISFAEVFTDAGFQKYIVQREFSDEKEYSDSVNVAFWSNFILSVVALLVICLFRHPIASLVGSPELSMGIAVSSISIVLVAFSSIQSAVYRREFDFKTLFYSRIASSAVPLVVTVPLAFVFRNFWALVIGTLAMHAVQAVILTIKSKWKVRLFYSFEVFKKMFSFASWTLLESISIWLTSYIGTFIVGRLLSDYYLGLYKTAMSTVNSFMAIATAAIPPVLFSALSRYQNDEKEFCGAYFKFQKMLAIFVFPMGVGIFVYQDLVTKILLGESWMEVSGFIGLWGLMSAVTVILSHFSSEVFRSKGKPKISLLLQLIHLAFLVPAIYFSAKAGFTALYVTRSLIRIQIIVAAALFMHFLFHIRISDVLKNIFPQTVSSLLMGLAGFFFVALSQNLLWQIVSVLLCGVIYFAILLCFPSMRKNVFTLEPVQRVFQKIKRKSS